MPRPAFARYAATAQEVAAEYFMPPPPGQRPDWQVDIWNWGVPEGVAPAPPPPTGVVREIPWSEMIGTYARLAPAVGAWSQQTLNASAVTVCVPLADQTAAGLGAPHRGVAPVSFAPQSLWYPGTYPGHAQWSHPHNNTYDKAMDDIEARLRAAEKPGQTVFALVYGPPKSGETKQTKWAWVRFS